MLNSSITGIVKPVIEEFNNPAELYRAAMIVKAMAIAAKYVLPMIQNLVSVVSLAEPASFFTEAPIKRILDGKEQFSEWFRAVTQFMRDGIINPVLGEMTGVNVGAAAKVVVSMSRIMQSLYPLIKNLSCIMDSMIDFRFETSDIRDAFINISDSITYGILEPMKMMPSFAEFNETVRQLSAMVAVLMKTNQVLTAMAKITDSISNSNIDLSTLDQIPFERIAALSSTRTTGAMVTGGGGGAAGGNPSDVAIQKQLAKDQMFAQERMSSSVNELLMKAVRGDGWKVQDIQSIKSQRKILNLQQEDSKNISIRGEKSVAGENKENNTATINPVLASSSGVNNLQTVVASGKAATSPAKTEVTSPELGSIASEASEQTAHLEELVDLFRKVLTQLQPKSAPITSGGGAPGSPDCNRVAAKPANFYRNTVGLVSQTSAKGILNVGTPNA